MSTGGEAVVAVAQQDEIIVRDNGDDVTIFQPDTSGNGGHAEVVVHRNNLASLILALRRLEGQEV